MKAENPYGYYNKNVFPQEKPPSFFTFHFSLFTIYFEVSRLENPLNDILILILMLKEAP